MLSMMSEEAGKVAKNFSGNKDLQETVKKVVPPAVGASVATLTGNTTAGTVAKVATEEFAKREPEALTQAVTAMAVVGVATVVGPVLAAGTLLVEGAKALANTLNGEKPDQ